ncbi:hypothetical protein ACR3K2_34170 [Cryptosporidium serpentis]
MSVIYINEKKIFSTIFSLFDFGLSTIISGFILVFTSTSHRYSHFSEEFTVISAILTHIPSIFLYMDLIIFQYNSSLFSNIFDDSKLAFNIGPNKTQEDHFSSVYNWCIGGIVLSICYITILSTRDIIVDIFSCYEIRNHDTERDSNQEYRNGTVIRQLGSWAENINSPLLISSSNASSNLFVLPNRIHPMNIYWLRPFVRNNWLSNSLQYISLLDDDDSYLSDFQFTFAKSVFYVPRVIPSHITYSWLYREKITKFLPLIIFLSVFLIHQISDLFLRFVTICILSQYSYWPWNFFVIFVIQTLVIGICFTFSNSPMTNLLVGICIIVAGAFPLMYSSQKRIKHSTNITNSLINIRTIEFTCLLVLYLILPDSVTSKESLWFNFLNDSYDYTSSKKNNNVNDIINSSKFYNSDINIKKFYWFSIIVFFMHQITKYSLYKISSIRIIRDNTTDESLDIYDNSAYISYLQFI